MTEHRLFYFPYGSFTDAQLPMLKLAALYFDKLVLLDPVGASWDKIGADTPARNAVQQLVDSGLLETVTPAPVLAEYGGEIAEEIRRDMQDARFLECCEAHAAATGKKRWTLALAKLPQDLSGDQVMRHLLGEFVRDVSRQTAYVAEGYVEHVEALSSLPGLERTVPYAEAMRAEEYRVYSETGQAYDERMEGNDGAIEYRYADLPLALGEAIMLNHALFAGLLKSRATPVTDDAFHDRALSLKLMRSTQQPVVREARAERARSHRLSADSLSVAALTDHQLDLPVLNPALPLEDVLDYRQRHAAELEQARSALGVLARRIESEPWTTEFANALEHKAIPDLLDKLHEARRARDAWLRSKRGRLAISAGGVAAGAAGAVLTLVAAPITPIALVIAGASLGSGSLAPGLQWLLDWRDGKRVVQENGLHYLVNVPQAMNASR